jgi:hypothetical protein
MMEFHMKVSQAREYMQLGVLTGFHAVRDPDGWLLVVEGQEGRSWTLQTALGKDKLYSTLDSLDAEVLRISGSGLSWSLKL